MSSVRKDSYFGLQIHKAPPELSKQEFQTSVNAHMSEWVAIPVVGNSVLRLNTVRD
jgi:hypothetical protein